MFSVAHWVQTEYPACQIRGPQRKLDTARTGALGSGAGSLPNSGPDAPERVSQCPIEPLAAPALRHRPRPAPGAQGTPYRGLLSAEPRIRVRSVKIRSLAKKR